MVAAMEYSSRFTDGSFTKSPHKPQCDLVRKNQDITASTTGPRSLSLPVSREWSLRPSPVPPDTALCEEEASVLNLHEPC